MSQNEQKANSIHSRWTEKLRCCKCHADSIDLNVQSEDKAGVVEGELKCRGCGERYPIKGGVYCFHIGADGQKSDHGETWIASEFVNLMPDSGLYTSHAEWLEKRLGYPPRVAQLVSEYESKYTKGRMLELLAVARGDTVLDLGSGVGYLTFDLLNKNPDMGIQGVCVDVLPEHVQFVRARQKDESNADIMPALGDGENLPLKDGSINGILSAECMEHVPNPQTCANEMFRVLTPNGQVLISTPNRGPYERFHRIRIALRALLRRDPGPSEDFFDNPLDHKELANYLRVAGFRVERIEFGIKVPMSKRILLMFPEKLGMGIINMLEWMLPGRFMGVTTLIKGVKPGGA